LLGELMTSLTQMIYYLLALVVSISIHEFAHAWSAYELGDSTARNQGRLTLNPVVHFDPIGALMILFMAFSGWGIGWGKPVPVNPYNLRTEPRLGMGLTSAAGPFSNLVLAALAAIPLRLGWAMPGPLFTFLFVLVITNIGLAVFNLIPLPPLDGFNVLQGLLATFRTRWAYEWGNKLDSVAAYGPVLLIAVLAVGWFSAISPLGWLLSGPVSSLTELVLGW
jgi:Zn-dependent protease